MGKAILISFALFALVVPASAAAQIVPPGNSAAAQYTETIPTSQGEKNAQGPKKHVNPNDVIGSKNTTKLEEQGPEGAAVAEFTAETAPTTSSGGEESSGGNGVDNQNGGGKPENGGGAGNGAGDGKGDGAGDGKGSKPQGPGGEEGSEATGYAPIGNGTSAGGSGPSGSSAVGEVASQATGVSSGALGLWLPIVLVAVVLWAAFMVWRRHEGSQRAV
jgi:hypothetical protein